jgi:hypothetical protein
MAFRSVFWTNGNVHFLWILHARQQFESWRAHKTGERSALPALSRAIVV